MRTWSWSYKLLVSVLRVFFPSSTICQSPCDPLARCPDLFIAFVLVAFLPKEVAKVRERETVYGERYFSDIREGLGLYLASERHFFLLLVASGVNFFLRLLSFAFHFPIDFTGQGGLCDHLTLGAIGSILGTLVCQ